jgi:hypothetical protein
MAQEKIDEMQKKHDYQLDQMTKDLQNRVNKVVELEMELNEVKDAYRMLE